MRLALAAICLLCGLKAGAQSPVWALHGAHNTVYLAGSVHLLKADESTLPPAFDRAYAASSTIVMEIDLSRLDAGTMQAWMLAHGLLPGETTLRDVVGEPVYRRTAAEAGRLGVPIEALQKFHSCLGDAYTVEFPTGSGRMLTLWQIALELERRLAAIFRRDANGRRPFNGESALFQTDPRWRDHILFHEYFHGDTGEGLGASHQTGWTGLIAKILEQLAAYGGSGDGSAPNAQTDTTAQRG